MKTPVFLVLLTPFLLVGCGDKSSSDSSGTNTTTSGDPLTAPVDYLGALGNAQKSAVKTVDTASIQSAIRMFQVDKDRLPKNLDELVTEGYMPRLPDAPYGMKLSYDAQTGTVKVVPAQ